MSGYVRVAADYGRVWHLASQRLIFGGPTLCGLRQSQSNHPRSKKVCRKCERLAAVNPVSPEVPT